MPTSQASPALFISADWSKDPRKRSVHVADLHERRIWREQSSRWDLRSLLGLAQALSSGGSVLVGLDLALGVPAGYWAQVLERPPWQAANSFLDCLRVLDPTSAFFETVRIPAEWRVAQPFFHVPAGTGGLRSFQSSARNDLLRRIDRRTGAKPMFAVSGIPGTVGSGTRSLWKELNPLLAADRTFSVWPFEGMLETLLASRQVVLAETYPGLAYAAALADSLPTHRLLVGKTKREIRDHACDLLEAASWPGAAGADLGDLAPARADEDAFDSHLTAAALLRSVIEGLPLCDPAWIDPKAEGAMLLAGPVDPTRRARRLSPTAGSDRRPGPARSGPKRQSPKSTIAAGSREYLCPIPGCGKVFHGSRGGWDMHAASIRTHPDWHRRVVDPEERKRLFKEEYREWF